MMLLYLSDKTTVDELENEIANFTIFYPISEIIFFFTSYGFYVKMYLKIDKLGVNWISYLMKTLLDKDKDVYENLIDMNAKFQKLLDKNKKKHLNKQDIITRQRYDNWIEIGRKVVKSKLECVLRDFLLFQFVGLNDYGIGFSNVKDVSVKDLTKEDETKDMLKEVLKDDLNTMIFNNDFKELFKTKDISILDIDINEKIEAYYFPLFKMPFKLSNFYTSEFLINLKAKIYDKFKPLALTIDENIKTISLGSFNQSDYKDLTKFYDSLIEINSEFQKEIDENLYFNMILNNFKECTYYQIYIGVTSKVSYIDYYEKINVIEPYMAKSLKDTLELTMGLDSCKFFYFIDKIEPANN